MHYLENAGSLIAYCAQEAYVPALAGACVSYAVPAITTALGATAIAVSPLQAAIFCGFYAGISPIMDALAQDLSYFIGANKNEIFMPVWTAKEIATYAVVLFATAYFAPTLAIPFTAAFAANAGVCIAVHTFTLLALPAMRLANSPMARTSQT